MDKLNAHSSPAAVETCSLIEDGNTNDNRNSKLSLKNIENESVKLPAKSVGRKLLDACHQNLLLVLVMVAAVLGFGVGVLVRTLEPSNSALLWLGLPGEIFIRALKCTIIPLLITSIISGTATLDPDSNKRITVIALIYIIISNTIGVLVGAGSYYIIRPAEHAQKTTPMEIQTQDTARLETEDVFADMIRNFFPENAITACFQKSQTFYDRQDLAQNASNTSIPTYKRRLGSASSPNILGILIICFVVGMATSKLGEAGRPVVLFFKAASDVIIIAMTWVIWLTPLGVVSLIAVSIAGTENVVTVFQGLGMFTITLYLVVFLLNCIIVPLAYLMIIRKNPMYFLLTAIRPVMSAFVGCSSAVAIPDVINAAENKHNVEPRLARFCALLNASISRCGSGAFVFMCTMFLADLESTSIGVGQAVNAFIFTVMATLALPAVPSASIICVLIVLSSIDVQTQNIGMIMAVDWLLDRGRTTSNVIASLLGTTVVNHFVPSARGSDDVRRVNVRVN